MSNPEFCEHGVLLEAEVDCPECARLLPDEVTRIASAIAAMLNASRA